MALVNMQVANPTGADIVTNGKTAHAHQISVLAFDDAALVNGWNDAVYFLARGCAVTSVVGATFEQREEGGFMLGREQQDTH